MSVGMAVARMLVRVAPGLKLNDTRFDDPITFTWTLAVAGKTVAQEGGTFNTPLQRCLCNGKSINELDSISHIVEDTQHD